MITEQLVTYIKEQLAQNASKEAIMGILIAQGWQKVDIDSAFSIALQSSVPASAPAQVFPEEQKKVGQPPVMTQPVVGSVSKPLEQLQQTPAEQERPSPVSTVLGRSSQSQPVQSGQQIVQDVRPAVTLQSAVSTENHGLGSVQQPGSDPNDVKGTIALVSIVAGFVSIVANFFPARGNMTAVVLTVLAIFGFGIAAIVLGVRGRASGRKTVATIGMILGILGMIIFATFFMIRFVSAFIIATVDQAAYQSATATPVAQGEYQNTQYGFSIMPPAGWQTDASGQQGAVVLFTNPIAQISGSHSVRSRINIVTSPLGGKTLDAYINTVKGVLPSNFQDFNLLGDQHISLNGVPARELEMTLTLNGIPVHELQIDVAQGDTVYAITGATLNTAWSTDEAAIRDSLYSFVFGTPQSSAINPANPASVLAPWPFIDVKNGFSMTQPANWTIDDSGTLGTLVLFNNPVIDHEGDASFIANISVLKQSSAGKTLDTFVSALRKLMATKLGHLNILSDQSLTLNGMPAHLLETAFDNGVIHLHALELITVKNGIVYEVTGTVLDATWDRYQAALDQSLRTFKLN